MRELLAVAALWAVPLAVQAQPFEPSQVEVTIQLAGSPSSARVPGYQLEVSYTGDSSLPADVVKVFAEPSHTLLLAHVGAKGKKGTALLRQMGAVGALAVTSGSAQSFRHVLTLPYNPGWGDDRIQVVLQTGGKDLPLSDAAIDLQSFQTISTVAISNEPGGPVTASTMHCCSNQRCGKLCITCQGAAFTCDLINCTIDCASF